MGNKRNRDNTVDLIDFDENFFEKPISFLDKNKKSQKSDSFLTKLIVIKLLPKAPVLSPLKIGSVILPSYSFLC